MVNVHGTTFLGCQASYHQQTNLVYEKYLLFCLLGYIVLPKAPEILEGQGVGPETDIWAVGVLAFIM